MTSLADLTAIAVDSSVPPPPVDDELYELLKETNLIQPPKAEERLGDKIRSDLLRGSVTHLNAAEINRRLIFLNLDVRLYYRTTKHQYISLKDGTIIVSHNKSPVEGLSMRDFTDPEWSGERLEKIKQFVKHCNDTYEHRRNARKTRRRYTNLYRKELVRCGLDF